MTGSQAAKSRGAVLLAQVGDSQAIASASGWPVGTIASYLSGQRRPGPSRQAEIARLWPLVTPESWDEPAVDSAVAGTGPGLPPAEPDGDVPPTGQAVNELARRLAIQARREVAALEATAAHADPLMFSKRIDSAAALVLKLSKLTGGQITERQILDSPRFRVIEDTIIRTLTPWPDALRAVGEALKDL